MDWSKNYPYISDESGIDLSGRNRAVKFVEVFLHDEAIDGSEVGGVEIEAAGVESVELRLVIEGRFTHRSLLSEGESNDSRAL